MAFNFPSNPSLNDSYSFNGKTWVFNGNAWIQSRIGGNDITTTGNISANVVTANIFIGDGSQLTGLPASYSDSNVATYLTTYDGNIAAGNILTDNYFYANGEPFVSSNYGDTDVENLLSGNITVGNISITGTIDGYATTTYVDNEVANLVASAPSTLDTLNELAAALGDDANFSTTVANSIGSIGANVSVLQGNIVTLETNITSLEANIPANLQTNVTTLESDVSTLQGNVSTIESNIVTLQNDVVAIDNQVANLNYYDDSNVSSFLSDIGSNNISTTGDITANAFIGDGSQLTGLPAGYTDSNVTALLSSFGNNAIETTGNISAEYFIGNGSQLTGIDTSGSTVTTGNVVPSSPNDGDMWFNTDSGKQFVYINDGDSSQWVETQAHTSLSLGGGDVDLSAVDQNIVPSANLVYDLGSSTNRWRDIYLANSTIYLGEANISAQGGALTLPSTVSIGNSVLDASSGNLTLPSTVYIGNVTIDASSGNLSLPEGSSIGGATVATPRIASIDYGDDDTAANIAGGQTIGIVGSGFSSGAQVLLDGSSVGVVTVVNSNRIEITAPAKSTGSYSLYVINSDGATGIYIPGIQYSGVPAWSSPSAGSLGSVYETGNISQTFSANSDSNVSYSLYSGNLPTGTTLDANTGVLSGTANLIVGSSVTYNFTIRATDEENQDTDRAFSLTVDADSVTWSSPTDGDTLSLTANTSSSTTLVASSAAGDTIDYTANTLPNGLSLSGNIISGTPTSIANTSVALTATANTTTRSATITVIFAVTLPLNDEYFNSTTLLLNGDEETFITDASDNAFTITPNGDTRPSAFSPYNTSWSNYFDGNGDSLTVGPSAEFTFGTGDWTVEYWVYLPAWTGLNTLVNISNSSNPDTPYGFIIRSTGTVGQWQIYIGDGATWAVSGGVTSTGPGAGVWQHHAHVRSSGTYTMYIDGVSRYSVANSTDLPYTYAHIGRYVYFATGYLSDFRVVKGTAVYTSAFTPPTEPLTAISGTSLLTCQSNRLIDNSTNNFTLTKNGDVKVTSFAPFTETDTSTGSGYFDGNGDYLTGPTGNSTLNNALDILGGDYTIEFWLYKTANTSQAVVTNFTNLGGNGWVVQAREDGAIAISHWVNNSATTVTSLFGQYTINAWNHIAVVKNSGNYYFYVNGVDAGIFQNGSRAAPANGGAGTGLGIGAYIQNLAFPSYVTGYISNLRIVKGTAVYTSNFTPPTAPLTAIANASLLTLQNRIGYNNSQPIDESGIKNVITRNGNASAGTFSPHVPTGWSGYFNAAGENTYIEVPVSIGFSGSTNDIIEFDLYLDDLLDRSASSSDATFIPFTFGTFTTYVNCGIGVNGNIGVSFRSGSTFSSGGQAPNGTITAGTWHSVKIEKLGTAIKLYVDGVEVATGSMNFSISFTYIWLGRFFYSAGSIFNAWSKGYLRNFKITQDDVVVLDTLRSNRFEDLGPSRYSVTPVTTSGPISIAPFSNLAPHTVTPDSYSVYFDGTGDYLTTPIASSSISSSTSFTIEFWAYWRALPASYSMFLSDSNGNLSKYIAYNAGAGTLDVQTGGSAPTVAYASFSPVVNTWYHLAFVRNGTTITIYVNGSALSMVQPTQANAILDSGSTTYIGRWAGTTPYEMNGYISNLRIVKGTASYTANFTPPTSPLTAISGTSLLTCQSPTVIDNSSNEFAITVNGNSQPTKFNPFGETVSTGVEYSPALHGGSVYFDGTGDWVTGTGSYTLGNTYTIEMWLYTNTVAAGNAGLINLATSSTTNPGINIYRSSAEILCNNGTTAGTGPSSGAGTITVNAWTHLAIVADGTNTKLYLDGVLKNTYVGTTGSTSALNFVTIGSFNDKTSPFNGYISNLRIIKGTAVYTSAFVPPAAPPTPVPSSILLINGTNAAIQDKTGRNVLETVGNARVLNGVKKFGSGAMYFDGTGDYLVDTVNPQYFFGTGDFTVECWVNPTTLNTYNMIFGYGSPNNYWSLRNTGVLHFYDGSTVYEASTGAVSTGQWTHIAISREGTTLRQFANGTQVLSSTCATSLGSASGTSIWIGASAAYTTQHFFTGYIDDLRITKGVARYTANFTPPTTSHILK